MFATTLGTARVLHFLPHLGEPIEGVNGSET